MYGFVALDCLEVTITAKLQSSQLIIFSYIMSTQGSLRNSKAWKARMKQVAV